MPLLTIFTPTYNRAYILHRCYESLKRQSCKDFIWLIADDGSTDNTRQMVQNWQAQNNGFTIKYLYQENQGMHGAHNLAYDHIDTELNTCIDSDDYMPDEAVEKIINFWKSCNKDQSIAGFLALDAYENGEIIGTRFPENIMSATYYDYYYNFGVKGDKKFILRSELAKRYPYPLFKGEKYVNLATKYSLLDIDFKFLNLNTVVCIVNYLEDGSTLNMFRQYVNNPKGFAYSRRICMALPYTGIKFRFLQAVHYTSSCIISKDRLWLANSPRKGLTVLALPAGILLYSYIKIKAGRKERGCK